MIYRCPCGNVRIAGVDPPPRCLRCSVCGARPSPFGQREEPAEHLFNREVEQLGEEGLVTVKVCYWCGRPRWAV